MKQSSQDRLQQTKKVNLRTVLILFVIITTAILFFYWVVATDNAEERPSIMSFMLAIKPLYIMLYIAIWTFFLFWAITKNSVLSSCVYELDKEIKENYELMEQT